MSFTMLSEARGQKPETIVTFECASIRERDPSERIHLREKEENARCIACGKPATVWFDNPDKWAAHKARCI